MLKENVVRGKDCGDIPRRFSKQVLLFLSSAPSVGRNHTVLGIVRNTDRGPTLITLCLSLDDQGDYE